MTRFAATVALLSVFIAAPAHAGPHADTLGACLADHSTGKDRKDLARWMFASMSAHPDLRDISSAVEATRDQASQAVASLFTRLLTEPCRQQARAAAKHEGSQAFHAAFGSLGKLAMQELMTNREVHRTVTGFERFVDRRKLDAALAER